jgi:hypothetical protein
MGCDEITPVCSRLEMVSLAQIQKKGGRLYLADEGAIIKKKSWLMDGSISFLSLRHNTILHYYMDFG